MGHEYKKVELLLTRYKALMEESYNIKETDPAISDYDFFEGLKIRKKLESQYRLKFKKKTQDLLE